MREIVIGRTSESFFSPELLTQLYRFRHRVFKERLGWQVESWRGLETDFFDELDPVHVACRSGEVVIGSFRLLPTTGSYMLRDVFPELLRGETSPCATDVWEMSRFAVEPQRRSERVQATCSEATFEMLRACYQFARNEGIREYVMVTSVAIERMMKYVGIPLVRLGDGRATRVGKVLSVACRVEISAELHAALYAPTQPQAAAGGVG